MCVELQKTKKKWTGPNEGDMGMATNEYIGQMDITAKAYSDISDWYYEDQFYKTNINRVSVL